MQALKSKFYFQSSFFANPIKPQLGQRVALQRTFRSIRCCALNARVCARRASLDTHHIAREHVHRETIPSHRPPAARTTLENDTRHKACFQRRFVHSKPRDALPAAGAMTIECDMWSNARRPHAHKSIPNFAQLCAFSMLLFKMNRFVELKVKC